MLPPPSPLPWPWASSPKLKPGTRMPRRSASASSRLARTTAPTSAARTPAPASPARTTTPVSGSSWQGQLQNRRWPQPGRSQGQGEEVRLSGAAVGISWRQPTARRAARTPPGAGLPGGPRRELFADGGASLAVLDAAREHYPISLHGVGLGLGSNASLDPWHLDRLARACGNAASLGVGTRLLQPRRGRYSRLAAAAAHGERPDAAGRPGR